MYITIVLVSNELFCRGSDAIVFRKQLNPILLNCAFVLVFG